MAIFQQPFLLRYIQHFKHLQIFLPLRLLQLLEPFKIMYHQPALTRLDILFLLEVIIIKSLFKLNLFIMSQQCLEYQFQEIMLNNEAVQNQNHKLFILQSQNQRVYNLLLYLLMYWIPLDLEINKIKELLFYLCA